MNLKSNLIIAFFISTICVIGFSLVSLLISDKKIIHFDNRVIAFIQGQETPVLTKVMEFFTFIGSAPFVTVLIILFVFFLYKVLHHRSELILFMSVIIGSAVLNGILKHIFKRVRPDFHRLIDISGYSYPSGHAMNAFTVYVILTFLLWRHIPSKWGRSVLIVCSSFMILAIGISRIYLGVHFPSDIMGGYLASGFWLTTAIWFFQYYQEKRYQQKYKRAGI
ncbi:phosphatase PAP2 family protein [Neobacillus sp. MM2021_6]|uniref:phosphatase PAP2 family protein n=1 Tax=Bacillaceae TaxID=186817 RepID=UPI00140C8787|nr:MULTISPECIES: phosphatase PAP2 family protein [Bacillaceae]MBO0961193.1 phosphatase PAP2 family protein [Neobacillus sp. MM2021_6]NHC19296.1 phosphatase PAP2 family protein [Bacillus sp. MM2020_4]